MTTSSPVTVAGWATATLTQASRVAKRFLKRNQAVWPVIRKARSALASVLGTLRGSPR